MLSQGFISQDTVNFAVSASGAEGLSMCLFTEQSLHRGRVEHEIVLDPATNRTGSTWHIAVPGLDRSLLYGETVLCWRHYHVKSSVFIRIITELLLLHRVQGDWPA